jgi:transglutaminase-like putative cysteine protease
MSDSMSPGDIAKLSESPAVAFRVEFAGPVPPQQQLYWRGLALSYFDGRRWTQSPEVQPRRPADWTGGAAPAWLSTTASGPPLRYRVILEPTDQPWLFALAVPASPTPRVGFTRDYRLVYGEPVYERLTYNVESWPDIRIDAGQLPVWLLRQNLQLPATGNPQARLMARRWLAGSGSPLQYVRDVLGWFRAEHFFYTLEPPALGDDRIDDFLFRTRRGFCEHYASSFVFLMRAAGIPARVVVGYQGGEKSPLGNYWVVRQLDAHAWAEVWLQGSGWVSVDPTAAVAPDRIQRGAEQMASRRDYWGDSGIGAVRYNNYRLLKGLRSLADYVNYRWHRDVLGYDSSRQDGLMQRLLGDTGLWRRLAVMGGLLLALGLVLFLWALRGQRRPLHPLDRLYLRYCRRLARRGLVREPGEGPQAFAERVAREAPELAAEAGEFARIYAALRYRPPGTSDAVLERRLRRMARGGFRLESRQTIQ